MKPKATRRPPFENRSTPLPELQASFQPETESESNDELVARLRTGDRSAWIALLDRYERLIYAVPRRCGLSQEDAADVFQDVIHAFLKGLPRLRHADALPSWLLRTAFRLSVRRRKMLQRHLRPERDTYWETIPDPRPGEADRLAELEAIAAVQAAMASLEGRCQGLLTALFVDEPPVSYSEISQRLGLPIGSLGPTRRRCLDQLLEALSEIAIKKGPSVTLPIEAQEEAPVPPARPRKRR